uniref:O-fucosyltransferase 6-like isoform X2 n=1 Tax=Erigeron canadensis TaxID=72917 RepID=UPI001CB8982B|nr:O-fucosyltransferase 6-like isoform X2 [Erigeron canadensis]
MDGHRRRHNHKHHRFRHLIPVISGTILILYFLLSFLAPNPDHFLHFKKQTHINDTRINPDEDNVDTRRRVTSIFKTSSKISERNLWSTSMSRYYFGCSNATIQFPKAQAITRPNRYLLIATSGGLNQQRTGITDAVVAARILNATLVVPKLDKKSFWKDASTFSEIFDVDWFISQLSKDVKIIRELPHKGGRKWSPYSTRVPRKCNERCYYIRVLPLFSKRRAVQLSKFDYRLANKLETDFQKLRCRVNYHALRFTDPIIKMGQVLVNRMRKMGKHFVSLHLRFEPDMLAFSGCYYGGGQKEIKELSKIRKRWKTLHISDPEKERRQGKCPLTPEEVGLMLRALGYDKDVHIYVASGEVYGGDETLVPLRALFPNIHSKDTIATKEELEPFLPFSSRMAALDFMVCDESDVFVTNNNGNMAKILAGRRRYFGHKPTIRPNAKKLSHLFMARDNMTWEEFSSRVRVHQVGFMGEPNEVRPGRGEFHENPTSCICEQNNAKANLVSLPRKIGNGISDEDEAGDDEYPDDDTESYNMDEDEDGIVSNLQYLLNDTNVDDVHLMSEENDLEELLSD